MMCTACPSVPTARHAAEHAAYRALAVAAERIGANNYAAGLAEHGRAGRRRSTYRYSPSAAHRAIVDAMPKVLAGRMTVDAAVGLLWTYDAMRERLTAPDRTGALLAPRPLGAE